MKPKSYRATASLFLEGKTYDLELMFDTGDKTLQLKPPGPYPYFPLETMPVHDEGDDIDFDRIPVTYILVSDAPPRLLQRQPSCEPIAVYHWEDGLTREERLKYAMQFGVLQMMEGVTRDEDLATLICRRAVQMPGIEDLEIVDEDIVFYQMFQYPGFEIYLREHAERDPLFEGYHD